ncbi:hypothetical protein [Nesterenkonia sandarakina]|uniref:Uncharacterized protein n=1 Tax=Nesterenkonia sandarakina TaxID=272918 RepID=A0A2T0YAD7_9MICC|nr:hypothetical protein [Nesterenkonia sandarakina]PRZ11604.1 hypothetical protein BCL67_1436 [Nesterenkonia sandarakina]
MGQITPEHVPAFPLYVIVYDAENETAELDGVPIERAQGVTIAEAATNAAARKAEAHGLDAVRVIVRSAADEEWTMIVSVDGQTIDTTPTPESQQKKPLIRPATVLGGALLTLGALGGGTALAVYLSTDTDQDQNAAPPWEIPGAGEQIPVGLPEGFTGPSDWSVDINSDTAATGLEDGRILTANSDGILSARDPETAEPEWAGSGAPQDLSEIHESTWTGQPVLASYSRGNLNLWPLEDVTPGDAVEPEQVPVANEAEILWDGDTPLVSLGDFIVLVPDDEGTLTEVTIPAGSDPVSAVDGEAVSLGPETIYRTGIDGEATSTDFTAPENVEGPAEAFWTIGTDALVLAWSAPGSEDSPVIAVIDQETGETIIEEPVEQLPNESAEITYNGDSQRAVIGTLAVRYDDDPSLNEIPAIQDPVIFGNTLYGNTTDGPALVDLGRPDDGAQPYATFTDEDTAPLIVADDAAYVVAPRLDQTILYRAAAEPAEEEFPDETDTEETTQDEQDD